MIVNDAKSALEAIDIIVQQGEGIEGSKFEDKCGDSLAHFFLFEKFANEYEGLFTEEKKQTERRKEKCFKFTFLLSFCVF